MLTVCVIIVAVLIGFSVLLQPSKADSGLGGLSSGGSESVLGTNTNEFLAKATWWLFGIFVVLCLLLASAKKAPEDAKGDFEKSLEGKGVTAVKDSSALKKIQAPVVTGTAVEPKTEVKEPAVEKTEAVVEPKSEKTEEPKSE